MEVVDSGVVVEMVVPVVLVVDSGVEVDTVVPVVLVVDSGVEVDTVVPGRRHVVIGAQWGSENYVKTVFENECELLGIFTRGRLSMNP